MKNKFMKFLLFDGLFWLWVALFFTVDIGYTASSVKIQDTTGTPRGLNIDSSGNMTTVVSGYSNALVSPLQIARGLVDGFDLVLVDNE